MSSIIKGLKGVREQTKGSKGRSEWDTGMPGYVPADWPTEPEGREDDEYHRQPKLGTGEPVRVAPMTKAKISYEDSEGEVDGKKYNNILKINTKDETAANSALKQWEATEWGAKEIVKKDTESDPDNTLVYIIDNHKYGMWKPFEDSPGKDPFKFSEEFKSVTEAKSDDPDYDKALKRFKQGNPPAKGKSPIKKDLSEADSPKLYPDQLARNAFNIARQIAYDETVPEILVQLNKLADENLSVDQKQQFKDAENRVFKARNHLESEVYKLSEIFAKDPYTDEDKYEELDEMTRSNFLAQMGTGTFENTDQKKKGKTFIPSFPGYPRITLKKINKMLSDYGWEVIEDYDYYNRIVLRNTRTNEKRKYQVIEGLDNQSIEEGDVSSDNASPAKKNLYTIKDRNGDVLERFQTEKEAVDALKKLDDQSFYRIVVTKL